MKAIRSALRAVAAEVGPGEAVLALAIALLAYGVSGWSGHAAAVAVALVLLWISLPARRGFIARPPAPDPLARKRRTTTT